MQPKSNGGSQQNHDRRTKLKDRIKKLRKDSESTSSQNRRKDSSRQSAGNLPNSSSEATRGGGGGAEFGDWSEQVSSSGKVYYYNRVSEISQWDKPKEWKEKEDRRAESGNSPSSAASSGGVEAMSMEESSEETTPHNGALPETSASIGVTHAAFARPELCGHVRGWAAEHFEAEARQLAATALQHTLAIGNISADLKCARSLVRTAEMRSTLLANKLAFVAAQQKHLAQRPTTQNAASTS